MRIVNVLLVGITGITLIGATFACTAPSAAQTESPQTDRKKSPDKEEKEEKPKGESPGPSSPAPSVTGVDAGLGAPTTQPPVSSTTALPACVQQCLARDPAALELANRLLTTCASRCACDDSNRSCRNECFACEDQVCDTAAADCEDVFRCDDSCSTDF